MTMWKKLILCLVVISCMFQVAIGRHVYLEDEVEFELVSNAVDVEALVVGESVRITGKIMQLTKNLKANESENTKQIIEMYMLEATSDVEEALFNLHECIEKQKNSIDTAKLKKKKIIDLMEFRQKVKNNIDHCAKTCQFWLKQIAREYEKKLYKLVPEKDINYSKAYLEEIDAEISNESIQELADRLITKSLDYEKGVLQDIVDMIQQINREAQIFKESINKDTGKKIEKSKVKSIAKIREAVNKIHTCMQNIRNEIKEDLNKMDTATEIVTYRLDFDVKLADCSQDKSLIKSIKENFTKECIGLVSAQPK